MVNEVNKTEKDESIINRRVREWLKGSNDEICSKSKINASSSVTK